MDALFSGLDSRLRVAVKVADSIMVGLVNAAMEDAYKKSLWKDGDLERLFQKLRFAELAIMQLEWCLRFVRGEMEADGGADDGHEELLDDLLETRDQIQARLDEAELAVAQADCDYMRRKRDDLDPSRRCRETPSAVDRRGAEVEVGCQPKTLSGDDHELLEQRKTQKTSCSVSGCPCLLPENYRLDGITFDSLEEIGIKFFTGSDEHEQFMKLLLSKCNMATLKRVDITVPLAPVSSEIMEAVERIRSVCHPNSKTQFNVHAREAVKPLAS